MNKEYIRFGEIPKDEKSKIGNGCIGDCYETVGHEKGVSVWNCAIDSNGLYCLVAPHGRNSCSYGDFSQAAFPDSCCGCDKNGKIYVVTGDEVGIGSDGEPLLRNVKIVKELPFDYFSYKEMKQ